MVNRITSILKNFGSDVFVFFAFQSIYEVQFCRRFGKERLLFGQNFTVPVLNLRNKDQYVVRNYPKPNFSVLHKMLTGLVLYLKH